MNNHRFCNLNLCQFEGRRKYGNLCKVALAVIELWRCCTMKKHLTMLLVIGFAVTAISFATVCASAGSPKASINQGTHATVAIGFADRDIGAIGIPTGQRMLVTQPAIVASATMATTPIIAIVTHEAGHTAISPADASRASPRVVSAMITDVYYNETSPRMAIARGTPQTTITITDDVAILTPEVARSGPIVVFAPFGATFART